MKAVTDARPTRKLAAILGAIFLCASAGAQLVFTTNFTGGDSTQQNSVTTALNSLATNFTSSITLKVDVTISDLGNSSTLGTGGPTAFQLNSGLYYAQPLFNLVTSTDLSGSTASLSIGMNVNAGITWFYGTGNPSAGQFSWQSVVMHEALHAMGFFDGIADGTGALANPGYTIFDSFTINTADANALFTSYTTDGQRLTAITSNALFWNGANGKAANGGAAVKLYAPGTFESGSTYSHIDPSLTGVGGLLFPALSDGVGFSGPTAVELGIMQDMGWGVAAIPEPATVVLIAGLGGLAFVLVRRRLAA